MAEKHAAAITEGARTELGVIAGTAGARFPKLWALAEGVKETAAHAAAHMREADAAEQLAKKISDCHAAARAALLKGALTLSAGAWFVTGTFPLNLQVSGLFLPIEPILGVGFILAGAAFTMIFWEKASEADAHSESLGKLNAAEGKARKLQG